MAFNQYDHFVPEEHPHQSLVLQKWESTTQGFILMIEGSYYLRSQVYANYFGFSCFCITSHEDCVDTSRLEHRVEMYASVGYRSVYISDKFHDNFPSETRSNDFTSLREILERISIADFDTQWDEGRYANLLAVFFDEIAQTPRQTNHLFMPKDRRL